ncbi:MAG: zf-HC2 domain-containing protein [Fimbriimonadaceae bacterium]
MKRDCRWVNDRLAGYREGWLGSRERAEVEAHLSGCQACRRELEADALLAAALAETKPVEAPDRSWADVRRRAGVADRRPWMGRLAWVAPAALAAALVGVWVSSPRGPSSNPSAVVAADDAPHLDDAFLLSSSSDAAGDPHRVLLAFGEAVR